MARFKANFQDDNSAQFRNGMIGIGTNLWRIGHWSKIASLSKRLHLWSKLMIPELTDYEYIADYKVWLKFEDGKEGQIDLEYELWGPVFEQLKEIDYFKTVRLDRELGTICWENGADFSPKFLYDNLKTDYLTQVWERLDIKKMSINERILLIDKIWHSIESERETLNITEAQKDALDRRIKSYYASP